MKATLVFVTICLLTSAARAQQDPLYSQYINNPFVLNPAYAGLNHNLNTALSYRQQWAGVESNPVTINANGHISLHQNKMGAGIMIVSDKVGVTTTNEVYVSYAYRVRLESAMTLSFGLQAGFSNYKMDNAALVLQDPGDPLFSGQTQMTKPSLGFGAILNSDRFFVGLSVPRVLNTTATTGGMDVTLYNRHFYAMGAYIFFVSERIRFKPSVLCKVVTGAPISADLTASFILHENYTAGLLTRNFSTYGVLLQALVKNSFRFGYVFEMPTNQSVGSAYPTHELTLGFRMSLLSFHENSSVTSF